MTRCEICGKWAPIPALHDCPRKVLDRIDREHRKADLEAEIQERESEEFDEEEPRKKGFRQ